MKWITLLLFSLTINNWALAQETHLIDVAMNGWGGPKPYFEHTFRDNPLCPGRYADSQWGVNLTNHASKNRIGSYQGAATLSSRCLSAKMRFDLTKYEPALDLRGLYDVSFVWHRPSDFYPDHNNVHFEITYSNGQSHKLTMNLQNYQPSEFYRLGRYRNLETVTISVEHPNGYNIRTDGRLYIDGLKLTRISY